MKEVPSPNPSFKNFKGKFKVVFGGIQDLQKGHVLFITACGCGGIMKMNITPILSDAAM